MPLLLFFLIIAVAIGLEKISLRDELRHISYDCKPEQVYVEPDQTFTVASCVTNRRRLPVVFLRLEELFPDAVAIDGDGLNYRLNSGFLRLFSTIFLMPKEILTRSLTASLPARGRYLFRGAIIHAGDFMGLEEKSIPFPQIKEMVVYPRSSTSKALPQVLGSFLGEHSVRRFILEDPILTLGFRDYTGREPQRYISWPRSLAMGKLMVKQHDYTQDLSAAILLNIDCGGLEFKDPLLIEEAFSLTRSVCEILEEKKIRYSFLTNAVTVGAFGQWSRLPSGLGGRHFYAVMAGLGRATYDCVESCADLFLRAEKRRDLDQGQVYLVITPRRDPRLYPLMKRLEAISGGGAHLLTAEPGAAKPTPESGGYARREEETA